MSTETNAASAVGRRGYSNLTDNMVFRWRESVRFPEGRRSLAQAEARARIGGRNENGRINGSRNPVAQNGETQQKASYLVMNEILSADASRLKEQECRLRWP